MHNSNANSQKRLLKDLGVICANTGVCGKCAEKSFREIQKHFCRLCMQLDISCMHARHPVLHYSLGLWRDMLHMVQTPAGVPHGIPFCAPAGVPPDIACCAPAGVPPDMAFCVPAGAQHGIACCAPPGVPHDIALFARRRVCHMIWLVCVPAGAQHEIAFCAPAGAPHDMACARRRGHHIIMHVARRRE